jgi:threonylcarbamoyladenosine tRNA methylthiotransferase MtaB
MPAHVPAATITERTARMTGLSRTKRLAYYQRFIGRSLPVLFERPGKDSERTGLTDNYLRVNLTSDEDLANTIRTVEITAALDGLALGHLLSSSPSGLTPLPLLA